MGKNHASDPSAPASRADYLSSAVGSECMCVSAWSNTDTDRGRRDARLAYLHSNSRIRQFVNDQHKLAPDAQLRLKRVLANARSVPVRLETNIAAARCVRAACSTYRVGEVTASLGNEAAGRETKTHPSVEYHVSS